MKKVFICGACGIVALGSCVGGVVSYEKASASTDGVVYYDVLTDEKFYELWNNDMTAVNNFLMEGGTIGGINYDKVTGDFKATSANGVVVGGETVDKSAGDFSVIIMGDQQTAVEYHSAYVASSYNWIAENADEIVYEFNERPDINDAFMLGDRYLIAPVIERGATEKKVYLPKLSQGKWQYAKTDEKFEGGREIVLPVGLKDLPYFIRITE